MIFDLFAFQFLSGLIKEKFLYFPLLLKLADAFCGILFRLQFRDEECEVFNAFCLIGVFFPILFAHELVLIMPVGFTFG